MQSQHPFEIHHSTESTWLQLCALPQRKSPVGQHRQELVDCWAPRWQKDQHYLARHLAVVVVGCCYQAAVENSVAVEKPVGESLVGFAEILAVDWYLVVEILVVEWYLVGLAVEILVVEWYSVGLAVEILVARLRFQIRPTL